MTQYARRMTIRRGLLYVIVDSRTDIAYARALLSGGVDWLQLRIKTGDDRDFLKQARQLAGLCHHYQRKLLINDRLDIACLAGADGLHLGQDDLPAGQVRGFWPGILGLSTHSYGEFVKGIRQPVDYLAVGPINPTAVKPDYPAVGIGLLRRVRHLTRRSLVAIGGIEFRHIPELIQAGTDIIGVYRALQNRDNPRYTVRYWKQSIEKAIRQ